MELGEEVRHEREGEVVAVMDVLQSRCGPCGNDIYNLYSKTVKRSIAPRPYDWLEAANSGGWSSATTPSCPYIAAQ